MVVPRSEPRAAWAGDESAKERRRRASTIWRRLDRAHPGAACALEFTTPLEILIATVLSAQCTDAKVNEVTRTLFHKYRTPEDYLRARPGELEADIRPTGFFNQKARSIRGLARVLLEEMGGDVPRSMAEMLRLPGVARKTANVVLGNAYGVVEGIAVDTHVHRLSARLALSDEREPTKVERDLMSLFPRPRWFRTTYLLIEHGRATCKAARPLCEDCVLNDLCPSARVPQRPSRRAR